MQDFTSAIERVRLTHQQFLMVGRRSDPRLTAPSRSPARIGKGVGTALTQNAAGSAPPNGSTTRLHPRPLPTGHAPLSSGVYWITGLVWKALDSGKPGD